MRYLTVAFVAIAASFFQGCDEPIVGAPFDASGSYEGTWAIAEQPAKQGNEPCPITLGLDHDVDAAFPQNLAVSGNVNLNFICFRLGRFLEQLDVVTTIPLPVTGALDANGNLILASPDLLSVCPEGEVCTRVALTGVGFDQDDDGMMDTYAGNWAVTLVVGTTPVPISGEFNVAVN